MYNYTGISYLRVLFPHFSHLKLLVLTHNIPQMIISDQKKSKTQHDVFEMYSSTNVPILVGAPNVQSVVTCWSSMSDCLAVGVTRWQRSKFANL
jgi:hypothetical protein